MKLKSQIIISALVLGMVYTVIPAWGNELQDLIDSSSPGEIVQLLPGYYQGPITMKEGVSLVGSGAGKTLIDGAGSAAVIEGAPGATISGITVSNGLVGVRSGGHRIGVFGCEFVDTANSAVYAGGGSCVLVNNLVRGKGQLGFQVSGSAALVLNNTIVDKKIALQIWKAPISLIGNNIIFSNESGVWFETQPEPEFSHNDFWSNSRSLASGNSVSDNYYLDPLFASPSDYSLLPASALFELGLELPALPPELSGRIGCDLSLSSAPDVFAALFAALEDRLIQFRGILVYTLTEKPGVFGVSVRQAAPSFRVVSSASGTRIEEVDAYDQVTDFNLDYRLIEDDPSAVEVEGSSGNDYPLEKERYVMDSIFSFPESLVLSPEGNLIFSRQTNMNRIRILIPEGWKMISCSPEPEVLPGMLKIQNRSGRMIRIALELTPVSR